MSREQGRRVVVMTGAGGGVGRATALAFAARGDRGRPASVDMAGTKTVEDAAQRVLDAF